MLVLFKDHRRALNFTQTNAPFSSPHAPRLSQSRGSMRHIASILASLGLAATAVLAEEAPDLDDPKVKAKIVAAAVLRDTLEERGPEGAKLFYAPNSETPFSG